MKIAGQKNAGAWYRANKVLVSLSANDKGALNAVLQGLSFAAATFNDMLSLAAETGIENDDFPQNVGAWLFKMIDKGIPWQIWNGRLSFTTYTRVETEDNNIPAKYVPNYQDNLRKFARQLRQAVKQYLVARRATNDVFDMDYGVSANPGGLPDARPESQANP